MPFPAGLPLVTVNCKVDTLPNGGASGFLRIYYLGTLTGPTDNSVVPYIDEQRTLAAGGTAQFALPPCNHPNWTPTFTYQVLLGSGSALHEGTLFLDYQTLTVELADLIQWGAATITPGVTYATTAQLTAGLATKANLVHTHVITDVTGLTTALNGKAALVHTHVLGDVTGLTTALNGLTDALDDKAPLVDPAFPGPVDVVGPLNIGVTGLLNIGADTNLYRVAANKLATDDALDVGGDLRIYGSLQVDGTVTGIDKADVGLPDVDNTSDTDKPVSTATQLALDAKLDADGGEIVDSTLTIRKSDNSSAVRFRSTGGAVDIDKLSGDVVISSFSGAGFTGTQTGLVRFRDTGVTVAGLTEFGGTVYQGQQSVDAAGGTANLGAKNTLTNLRIAGFKATFGAPLTGDWATGDVVLATDGIWRCTTGGTPGVWRCVSGPDVNRIVDDGEVAVNRQLPTGQLPLTDGQLLVTHWTAQVTETVQFFRTSTGDTPTLATPNVDNHAWVGVMRYDGTQYFPEAVSVDDPTLWTAPFADYETQLFDAATASVPGWSKMAGQRYASWFLWNGPDDPPELAGKAVWAEEPYREPRLNGYIGLTAPPSSPLNDEWLAPDWRLLQAHLKR
jgi:hypothetical protein